MKPRRTTSYGTVNPAHPECHSVRYDSRRVCDGTWGRQWTRRYVSIEVPYGLASRVMRAIAWIEEEQDSDDSVEQACPGGIPK